MYNNYNLCHIKTINWEEIITGPNRRYSYVYNFTSPERICPECDKSCEQGCWGDGPENCQRFSKTNCSPQCWQGRCFGPNPRECCHLFCAGGCTGPKQSDCLACKNFYDDGVCTQECPPMQKLVLPLSIVPDTIPIRSRYDPDTTPSPHPQLIRPKDCDETMGIANV
jgi:epidermal growth factor receptor